MSQPSFLMRALVTGGIAATATSALVTLFARRNDGAPAAGLNAVSHTLWGDRAYREDHASLKYTATGATVNFGACLWWAALHELLHGKKRDHRLGVSLARGASTAAAAYLFDYHLLPRRLTPGYEGRLDRTQFWIAFAALAAALPLRAHLAWRIERNSVRRMAREVEQAARLQPRGPIEPQTQRAPSTSTQIPLTRPASSLAR